MVGRQFFQVGETTTESSKVIAEYVYSTPGIGHFAEFSWVEGLAQ